MDSPIAGCRLVTDYSSEATDVIALWSRAYREGTFQEEVRFELLQESSLPFDVFFQGPRADLRPIDVAQGIRRDAFGSACTGVVRV